jgi:hypothetical protein
LKGTIEAWEKRVKEKKDEPIIEQQKGMEFK